MDYKHLKIILKTVPILTEENYASVLPFDNAEANRSYFIELQTCVKFLKNKYAGIITGLWFIQEPAEDGGTQVIIRTNGQLPALQKCRAVAEIFDFTEHEMSYLITDDDMSEAECIPLEEMGSNNQIYALMDTERGV